MNAYVDSFVESDVTTSTNRAETYKRSISHNRTVGKLAAPLPRAKYVSRGSARMCGSHWQIQALHSLV